MSKFGMSESSYFDAPDLFLKHTTFPYLIGVTWDALNRFMAMSVEAFVTSLMRSATSNEQHLAIHDFMAHELAEYNRRGELSRDLLGALP